MYMISQACSIAICNGGYCKEKGGCHILHVTVVPM